MSRLFASADAEVRELQRHELAPLQRLFEANPQYFWRVGGQGPRPDEALLEFDEEPPPGLGYGRRFFAGVCSPEGRLFGVVIVLTDFCASGVWHIALFMLDSAWHGTGAAARLHAALQAWALAGGARWLRLGVVAGNTAAERFWAKTGYQVLRTREIVNAAGQPATVQVCIKPLAGATLAAYLQAVPRDRPDYSAGPASR